jgi:hypothetical protein
MGSGRLAPETDRTITEPFEVRDRAGVLRELRRMVDRESPIVIYAPDGQSARAHPIDLSPSALTLAIEAEDAGSPALRAKELVLVALVDDVKVQGEIRGPLHPDGEGVVRLVLPEVLVRLQRRAGYRVRIPGSEPSFLHVRDERYPVLDLSVRGVGVEPLGAPPPVGQVWSACRLRLGLQVLPVSVVVRYVDRDRIGCSFTGVDRRVEQELGRRVMDLDRLWMRTR